MMDFYEIAHAGGAEIELFLAGREAAQTRLNEAHGLCDAVAGQDLVLQAQATIDLENAKAVASEWGLISIATELKQERAEGKGLL